MPSLLLTSAIASTTATTVAKKSTSGSSTFFFVIILAFAAVYFFFLRPRQKRLRQGQGGPGAAPLAIGDEVISAGGILGTVTAVAGDEIVVEVSPGQTLTFWRRAINLRTAVKGAPQSSSSSTFDDQVVHDDADYGDEPHGDVPDDPEIHSWGSEEEAGAHGDDGAPGEGDASGPGGTTAGDDTHHDTPGGTGEGR